MRAVLAAVVFCALPALAQEAPAWPPSPQTIERMRSLQEVIRSSDASGAQREAAREELAGLLKSPAGQARGRTMDERPTRPARAAVEPIPSYVRPTEITVARPPPAEGVAQLEVIAPPKPVVNPQTGSVLAPTQRFAVDPRTGGVLHEIPGGFIDPRTGQVLPR